MEEKRKPSEWREMLLQYRLNELDEAQREEVDTRLITDEEFAEALQGAEYDLLDAYAANELSPRDRTRVEQALRPAGRFSPEATDRIIPPARIPAPVSLAVSTTRNPGRRWLPGLVLAAAVLIAAVLFANHRHAESSNSSMASPLAQQTHPPSTQAAPSLPKTANADNQQAATTSPPPNAGKPPSARNLESVATLVLPPALRSTGSLRLPIANGTQSVLFVWPLDEPTQGAQYKLQVVSEEGTPGCQSRGIVNAHGSAISFTCSAGSLPSGAYFVRVSKQAAAPDDPPLMELPLTVVKSR